jgi:hypothetical protein
VEKAIRQAAALRARQGRPLGERLTQDQVCTKPGMLQTSLTTRLLGAGAAGVAPPVGRGWVGRVSAGSWPPPAGGR